MYNVNIHSNLFNIPQHRICKFKCKFCICDYKNTWNILHYYRYLSAKSKTKHKTQVMSVS